MVHCGVTLEREKAALRRQLTDSRREQGVTNVRLNELETALEREEERCQFLRTRTEKVESAERLRQEEREAKHQAETKFLRQAEEDSRSRLLAHFEVQKGQWERTREALATRAATVLAELSSARRVEARAVEEAFRDGQHHEAEVVMKESVWKDSADKEALSSEMAACGEMATRLRVRLAEVEEAERMFQPQQQASTAASSTVASGPSTPRLRELDAYAELVDRLRKDVLHEREERESAQRSLQSLRSSYRLLLQRSGAATQVENTSVVAGGTR
jgi:hypothetical protein